MNVISINKLCKSYGNQCVLYDIDLDIAQGRLVGFLGPNGAGKTTTIRVLLGLLSHDSGSAEVFDMPCGISGKAIRREIGYLPGDVHFYSNLSGQETLRFMANARRKNCESEILRLAKRLDLDLRKTVRKYSTGMRQKLGLIQALMHRPKLLILDEPTSALDPLVRTEVFDELRRVVREGRSVLFSSHSLNEVEELCDEVVILRNGRIVEHQTIEVLRRKALRRVTISFVKQPPEVQMLPPHFQIIKQDNHFVTGTWSSDINLLLEWLKLHQIDDLIVERPDLNDLFMTYYSETPAIASSYDS